MEYSKESGAARNKERDKQLDQTKVWRYHWDMSSSQELSQGLLNRVAQN